MVCHTWSVTCQPQSEASSPGQPPRPASRPSLVRRRQQARGPPVPLHTRTHPHTRTQALRSAQTDGPARSAYDTLRVTSVTQARTLSLHDVCVKRMKTRRKNHYKSASLRLKGGGGGGRAGGGGRLGRGGSELEGGVAAQCPAPPGLPGFTGTVCPASCWGLGRGR